MRRLRWSSLRRITSDGNYIPEIDGLRFVAIASVVLFHVFMITAIFGASTETIHGAGLVVSTFLKNGERGVELFFAISGMVLGLPFARHRLQHGSPVRIKPYLLRRVTRLEPPYIINLLLRAPLVAVARHLSAGQIATHLLVSVFYADFLVYHWPPIIHMPSWSLAVEVQFYLLAPLLAIGVFHEKTAVRRGITLVVIGLCSMLAAWLPGEPLTSTSHLSLLAFFQYFLVGMLVADLYLTVLPRFKEHLLWDVISLPLWVAFFWLPAKPAAYLLPWILLILIPATFLAPTLRHFFRAPFVTVVGGMCYSLYLMHSLVLQGCAYVVIRAFKHPGFWISYAEIGLLTIPATLLVGAIFFLLIERPCMDKRWPQKLWNRLHGRPTETQVQAGR